MLNIFYTRLNHDHGQVHNLMTDLDHAIPFVPIFILPYVIWYAFIVIMLATFCAKDRGLYYRTLFTQCLGLIACFIIYSVFQTTVPRPEIPVEGMLYRVVNWVYSTDNPYNCFPSVHVLTSYLMIKGTNACPGLPKPAKILAKLCAVSIIVSTLFVKQHALLDIAAAVLLVELLWAVVFRLTARSSVSYKGEGFSAEHYYINRG